MLLAMLIAAGAAALALRVLPEEDLATIDRDAAYADPVMGFRKLRIGNRRFVEGRSIRPRQDRESLIGTSQGQRPFAIIVGCSDSRVPNEIIFDQGVGDLFIIRTAGQVAGEASIGSIEYAVIELKTKLVVVLGHTECGAVRAAVQLPDNPPGAISYLINHIRNAVEATEGMPGDPVVNAVRQNVIDQVATLRRRQPILSRRHREGEILIVGAVYDIADGRVTFLEETLEGTRVVSPA